MKLTRRQMTGGIAALAMGAGAQPARTETPAMQTTATTDLPFAATTPVSIGRVGLKARDGSRVADYYKAILGLKELRRTGNTVGLGVDGRELLEIEERPSLQEDDPRSAGLFHTAFLLPSRADLARWARQAIETRLPIDGASDHEVSEAVYLTDPEGNGIEIYADRAPDTWRFDGERVRMGTRPLNVPELLAVLDEGDAGWTGAPEATVIGHVHLRVGDVQAAEEWWNRAQGFETMLHYGDQAVFLSSGGYHHHIGANIWRSAGAGPRAADRTGLSFVELVSKAAAEDSVSTDPWGTEIRVLPARG